MIFVLVAQIHVTLKYNGVILVFEEPTSHYVSPFTFKTILDDLIFKNEGFASFFGTPLQLRPSSIYWIDIFLQFVDLTL